MEFTKNELEIMDVLWDAGEPLSRSDILEQSPKDKSWKDSSIHIILNSLLSKGAIKEVGFSKNGRGVGRTFGPIIDGEEYYAQELAKKAKKTNISKLVSALVDADGVSDETLQKLADMLEKRKKK